MGWSWQGWMNPCPSPAQCLCFPQRGWGSWHLLQADLIILPSWRPATSRLLTREAPLSESTPANSVPGARRQIENAATANNFLIYRGGKCVKTILILNSHLKSMIQMGLNLLFIKGWEQTEYFGIHSHMSWMDFMSNCFMQHFPAPCIIKILQLEEQRWVGLAHPSLSSTTPGWVTPPDLHTFTHTKFPVPCPGLSWMKSQSFSPYPFALNYWYERREVMLAFTQVSLLEGGWGEVRRRPGAFRVQVVFFPDACFEESLQPQR